MAAGRIVAENGVLKAVWPHSGHYRPTPENFQDFKSFLKENNLDMTDVKFDSNDDEDEKSLGKHLRTNSSEDDSALKDRLVAEENDTEDSNSKKMHSAKENMNSMPKSRTPLGFGNLTTLRLPSKDDLLEKWKCEKERAGPKESSFASNQQNVSEEPDEANYETIPENQLTQKNEVKYWIAGRKHHSVSLLS